MGAFFSASKEDEAAKAAPVREAVREQAQASPLGPLSIDAKLANLDRRMNLAEAAREKQGKEPVLEHFPDRGFGIER